LKAKKKIRLLSTATYGPDGKATAVGALTNISLHPMHKVEHLPRLGTSHRNELVKFKWWWENEIVFVLDSGAELNRKDLVLAAANKDGGGHVDKAYDKKYEELMQGQGVFMTVNPSNAPSFQIKSKQAHLAALRQIGYEVLTSPDVQALTK
jgi:hypothetical protein